MNLLLDTHTFIWFVNGDNEISSLARKKIEKTGNQSFISIASLWEISIKIGLQKLEIHQPFKNLFSQIEDNGFILLPIKFEHLQYLTQLPFIHRDPFDRLLVSQSVVEDLVVVSKDMTFRQYQIKHIW